MPTGLLYSQRTFLSSQSEMLVTGVLILPLGEHQKILTISFTRVFSLALNAVQFTFEIRCRGEQNVTRHFAVVLFFFFQCYLLSWSLRRQVYESKRKNFLISLCPYFQTMEILYQSHTQNTHLKQPSFAKKKEHLKNNNNNVPKAELNETSPDSCEQRFQGRGKILLGKELEDNTNTRLVSCGYTAQLPN